jgi:hypothetical protein
MGVLAVVALVGRLVALFALFMLVPLLSGRSRRRRDRVPAYTLVTAGAGGDQFCPAFAANCRRAMVSCWSASPGRCCLRSGVVLLWALPA